MYNEAKKNGRMPRESKQSDKALSNTFVRRIHAVLQSALKQAVKERLIPYNPCENCRIPPKDKKEMTVLPPEKIGRYLQEAEKYGVLPCSIWNCPAACAGANCWRYSGRT